MNKYDFSGWATKANLRCSDGRIIMKDAFKHNDGKIVPLVWNHKYDGPDRILGKALLEHRDEGVYAYCVFNETETGKNAKLLVQHGDINAMSILANQLKHQMSNVLHGDIKEVSLVVAGANPGAFIESVMMHGEESEEDGVIFTGEEISLYHADEPEQTEKTKEESKDSKEETVDDVWDTFTEKQKKVVHVMISQVLDEGSTENNDDAVQHNDQNNDNKGGDNVMKKNIFDEDGTQKNTVLMHADQVSIINTAKSNSVGSLRTAIEMYVENNDTLKHGIDDIESLFPEHKDVRPGAPELIQRDQGWVSTVMQKTHKSPISRIRTRQADARGEDLHAKGYKKGDKKNVSGNIKLLKRTTDPQTVYRKDALHRDDIIDITDFDVVEYQYGIMRQNLYEELAKAIMIGDGRDDGDADKIEETHIRSIWNDDDLYTIHTDVDIEAARKEIQGSDTDMYFGENYIYAEAIITAALYSREKYKGSGKPDFYCTPHLVNVMLLARDRNGRRIYDSISDLAKALNVGEIYTAEQFEGKIRTTDDNSKKKLLGLFVNLADYQIGATKGGEITRFNQFDIDFNQEKYLIETRLSGALTRIYSAIALEEDVTDATG